jgi:hypothetical protein
MEDNMFDKLQEFGNKLSGKFSILEEQIDVNLQLEYFKFSKKTKPNKNLDINNIPDLSSDDLSVDDKKKILVQLAKIDDPRAFRFIENFSKNVPTELKDWTILSLQESRMLLESSLLDENQVFISTGLGGKNNMLRYFVVIIGDDISEFNDFHKKIIASEFEFALKKQNCKLEEIQFKENYAMLTTLIPFNITFQNMFRTIIEECNQYGSFLSHNFIVTNVKKLSVEEITDFVKNNKIPEQNDIDDIDLKPLDDYTDEE